ncbi:MAG TPA: alpha/beta hydrolase [Xanthobacteraceae bacterium]
MARGAGRRTGTRILRCQHLRKRVDLCRASSAAAHCRAIAFDRPGFGYSTRPFTRQWTPTAQADLLAKALQRLGCERAVIVGHSWGTLTALALAQQHPELVRALVLLSGLYYPRPRFDALLAAAGAMPVLGDILRYTLMPLAGLLMLPLVRRNLFAPAAVPEHLRRQFPWLMTLRPWQLRASLADGALMLWSAALLAESYRRMRVPAFIAAGAEDRIVDAASQSGRLATDLLHSRLDLIEGVGHMIQHSAPDRVIAAINRAVLAAQADLSRTAACRPTRVATDSRA